MLLLTGKCRLLQELHPEPFPVLPECLKGSVSAFHSPPWGRVMGLGGVHPSPCSWIRSGSASRRVVFVTCVQGVRAVTQQGRKMPGKERVLGEGVCRIKARKGPLGLVGKKTAFGNGGNG